MRPSLHLAQHVLEIIKPALLPATAFATCVVPNFTTAFRHSLFVNAIAWLLVFVICAQRLGVKEGLGWGWHDHKRKFCLLSGALYAAALACERAAADPEGLLAPQALLPFVVYIVLKVILDNGVVFRTQATLDKVNKSGLRRLLVIITGTGAVALSCSFVRFPVTALGVSSTIFKACSLLLLEYSFGFDEELRNHPPSGPNGLIKPVPRVEDHSTNDLHVARDMAAVVAVSCFLLSLAFESLKRYEMVYMPQEGPVVPLQVKGEKAPEIPKALPPVRSLYSNWDVGDDVQGVFFETAKAVAMLFLVRHQGSFDFSLISVGAALLSRIINRYSHWELWLSTVYALAALLLFDDFQATSIFPSSRRRLRARQLINLIAAVSLLLFFYQVLFAKREDEVFHYHPPKNAPFFAEPPMRASEPLRQSDSGSHPMDQLIKSSESQFANVLHKQSKSLEEAVVEYRRRYGLPPPPKFDMWYEFAKRRNVQLIDEYDTIFEQLQPFWGLEPKVIRARVAEAIGFENMLLTVMIRNGETVKVTGGAEWQQDATVKMMTPFVEHLPDMDLPFNIHDEPRVIVPADILSRLMHTAQTKTMPAAFANKKPKNHFSKRPNDLGEGKYVPEVRTTRFNRFAHQHTWSHSRASCPVDSPARDFEELSKDNATAYAYGELGFMYNVSAFQDICLSPSLRETYGFFDRPNAFNIVQDLFPVFSQSKISSYQDILYPSPWYWATRVGYIEERDMEWEKKESQIYWRGSTTGGFSRNGGWRRQHRQRVVRKLNAPDRAKILQNKGVENEPKWAVDEVNRRDYSGIVDIKFSHVGQCDPTDCEAQQEYFEVVDKADQQDAWRYKFLLDMDGNAFSGRFYAFLKSKSLVYKLAVFQEWHKDWLKPWVHYIPMTLKGDEWLETVRYFAGEEQGKATAPRLAAQGREWAQKALRNEDFEVWFFRLLLEYGRLIDDHRENIGYPGP